MPCFYPLDGYRSAEPNENGKHPIVFSKDGAQLDEPLRISCGRCIGCRLEYSRNWAIRCLHESSLYENNCFITLTYNDENLPHGASLYKPDFQDFMKRYRKKYSPLKIRFFMCGEYGTNQDLTTTETIGRPHFHALIFNHDFPKDHRLKDGSLDVQHLSSNNGNPIYTSQTLTKIWGKGHASFGDLTYESAAYVARYCLKKITGDGEESTGTPSAADHYRRIDPITGEITYLHPEFTTMSRMPGIAYDWFQKYQSDLHKDFITHNGVKMRPPKYYDKLLEKYDDGLHADLVAGRSQEIDILDPENTLDRLRVKETIKKTKLKQLKRVIQ